MVQAIAGWIAGGEVVWAEVETAGEVSTESVIVFFSLLRCHLLKYLVAILRTLTERRTKFSW